MANFGPLTAEIGWRVCDTPANFNGFRVLASILQRRRSTEVNQTLHDVWPSRLPGWHTIYTFSGALAPNGILPGAKFSLRPSFAFSYIGSVTARPALAQWASAKLCRVQQRVPPIFGRAAIALGIGPHSSY